MENIIVLWKSRQWSDSKYYKTAMELLSYIIPRYIKKSYAWPYEIKTVR